MKHFILLLVTGFGAGYSPVVPGTLGTLAAIPVYLLLSRIPSLLHELTLLAFFFLSVWLSDNGERTFGKKDDRRIVIDEIIGFLMTMLWVEGTALTIALGFGLFRLFDILKPFPIRRAEKRFKGGWGVVLDDVMAGIYANISLHIIVRLITQSPSGPPP